MESIPHAGTREDGRFVRSVALGVFALAALVLGGWLLDLAQLKSVLPGLVSMKANTAVGFALAALALGLAARRAGAPWRERVALGCALAVVALGAATLSEDLFTVNLGLDQLLFHDTAGAVGTASPGRMAPLTAIDFVLLGTALVLARRSRRVVVVQVLAALVMFSALFFVIGYVYGVSKFYRAGDFTAVAIHTAAAFLAMGAGVLGLRADAGLMRPITSTTAGDMGVWRLLVLAMVLPVAVGWLRLQGQRVGLYDIAFGQGLMTMTVITVLVTGIWWVSVRLGRADQERQRVVDALRHANEQLEQRVHERTAKLDGVTRLQRAVLDGTVFSVIATRPDGVIEIFNRGAERMLGYTAAEMVGRQTPAVLHLPEEVKARAGELSARLGREIEPGFEAFAAQARLGVPDEREWTYVAKDGSRVPVHLSITRLTDEAGAITGFLGVAQDLTARRNAETALQASEERLHRVLSNADCLMWEAQVTHTGNDWTWQLTVHPSGLYRRLRGEELAVASVGLWYRFDIPEQAEMNRRSQTAMETGAPGYEQEFRLQRNGETTWIHESVAIKRTGSNGFWLVGVALDITEQKRARAARDEIAHRLNKLGAQVPGIIFQFRLRPDGTSCFPYASEGIREIYRVAPEEVREDASKIFGLVHPDDVAAVTKSMQVSARTLQPWIHEYRTRLPDGTERWLLGNSVPEREADGSVLWHGFTTDITERKQLEDAVSRERGLFHTVIDLLPHAVYLKDRDSRFLMANQILAQFMGKKNAAQLIGLRDVDLYPARVAAKFRGDEQRVLGGHEVREQEETVTFPSGETRTFATTKVPFRDAQGKITGILGTGIDITERKLAEQRVVQSERLLANVTGILPGMVAYWTADLRCAFSNAECFDWFGKTAAEMRGIGLQELLGEAHFREIEPKIRGVLAGKPQRFERRLTKADGTSRQTWAQYIPDFEPDQAAVKGFVVLVSDITEMKQKEEALRASEAQLARQKFAVDQHAIVAVTDLQGSITYANDKFCEISGYARAELLGQNHRLINSGHHSKAFFTEMFRVITGGEVWHGEICNRAKDGRLYWEESTIVPFKGPEGEISSYVAIRSDITERKHLEQNLAIARDQALEASRLKSEFLATMSHEIRTPMNAIIGMAGLLVETPLNPEQADMARTLAGGAESLLVIINDILDFSRIEAGQLRLDPADFDLRRVVEETIALLAPHAHEKGLELASEFQPAPACLLLGDGGRVRQILMNLIGNAVKFTDAGEVVVLAGVLRETEARVRVRVTVQDTGIGIPVEARDRLFRPFVQVDGSNTRRFGGTGLGLAITRQLVWAMEGEIGFESEAGRGSMFWIELEFPRRGLLPTPPAAGVPAGRRVLVVDDNATNRAIMLRQLAHCGLEGEAVADGAAALARFGERGARPWDLVLIDWQMPAMSGLELAMEIRADPALAALPLVMLSSSGPGADIATATAVGFAAYLSKPVTEANLARCLARVLTEPPAVRPLLAAATEAPRPAVRARLLLVEDNPANQRVASILLAKLGHIVEVAANGQLALDRLAEGAFDAVLMDCQMPVLDGYDTTRRIRSGKLAGIDARVPIIALTAYARDEDRARCLEAGMDAYVSKPIRVADLQAAFERCGLGRPGGLRPAEELPLVDQRVLELEAVETARALPGARGASLLPELVELYLSDEQERLARLVRLLAARKGEELADEVHSFGGNAASFGGGEVRRVALELERAARVSDWPEAKAGLARLRKACGRLRAAAALLIVRTP